MAELLLIGGAEDALPTRLAAQLGAGRCRLHRACGPPDAGDCRAAVYLALSRGGDGLTLGLEDAGAVLAALAAARIPRLVVVSSTAVYHPSPRHAGMLTERRLPKTVPRGSVAADWRAFEELARRTVPTALSVIRAGAVPLAGGSDVFSRLFTRSAAVVPWGYDPPLQILSLTDLAAALEATLAAPPGGPFNLAPRSPLPLGRALRRSGTRRLPLPPSLRPGGGAREYLRYPWTVSAARAAGELGWEPRHTSGAALTENLALPQAGADEPEASDDFGLDPTTIDRLGRTLFRFLHDRYWRVEVQGIEHVPRSGGAVLVGVHRGYQPWDAIMTVHHLTRELGRTPRFLVHPTIVKFPFIAPFMTKLGGIYACRENADWVLERGELLGIFPEGVRGAFSLYRDAYRLQRFGRDEFVRIALARQVPIVPFVTVGTAEALPIFAKLNWRWWKRLSSWPCLPITVPLPLPSKWHTRFLEPLRLAEEYPPEAAADRALVAEISDRVRRQLQTALGELRDRRPSIFYGSAFEQPAAAGR